MGTKRIAVQEGLHEEAKLLRVNGYEVTTVDNATEPIDVIVYSNKNTNYLAHNTTGKLGIESYNKFVKMINVEEVGREGLISVIEEIQ
ncbi:hypothetical protein Amet_2901 [Alkaliphilus metalliredigens QYMF]|uniref:Uncharacterized protein n=1 Tax=Alkaliphilus metalliredigens (strain QYMF) TaxID=293826 RepID=A6TS83_ALKMQ|nr:YkuS family protein [Alkaliphilus metalliredigens]ABR49051.1 hypothetical protein Amet_2901 [Alkaliphilus metalliredigens QYMF]